MIVDGQEVPDENADAFSDAFAEAAGKSDEESKKPEDELKDGEGGTPTEDDKKAEIDKEEVKDDSVADKVKAEVKEPTEELEVERQKYKDLEHKHKTLEGMFNSLNEKVKTLEASKPKQEKEVVQEKVADNISSIFEAFYKNMYNDLDDVTKKTLKDYDEEFDTPSKIEDIKRQHALKKVIQLVEERNDVKLRESLTELADAVKKVIQPLFETVEHSKQSEHYRVIKHEHPDFEKYRDDGSLKGWIAEQPNWLKSSLEKVYENGSTEDVIDMYTRFKADKGLSKKKVEETDEAEETEKKAREAKLKLMETVKSKTTGVNVVGTGKAENFDDAFEEAISKVHRR